MVDPAEIDIFIYKTTFLILVRLLMNNKVESNNLYIPLPPCL